MLSQALSRLRERHESGRPLRVGLIGAGTFGTMILSQLGRLAGVVVAGVADLDPDRARAALARAGVGGEPVVTDDADRLLASGGLEVVIESTGAPAAGVAHAVAAIDQGVHVVMVNVEADVLAGPALAARARAAGVVYSLAYGDQPALICELVDWARASGFEVVCAGKGTKYLPGYHEATPDTVWGHYGMDTAQVAAGGYNARMFTSFLDGTKSAIEMAAVCNATGLVPQDDGLRFPPCGAARLSEIAIPEAAGGALGRSGTVEVVSSVERDGSAIVDDLRWGVYVTFAAGSDFVARCFADYGVRTDSSGQFASLYRPSHLIGLETPVSVLAAGLLGEPTGAPDALRADVVAVAKRDLTLGEILDGEGGFTVHGRLAPAAASLAADCLPIGFAHGARLMRPVAAGQAVTMADLEDKPAGTAWKLRQESVALRA
jgi:predicted homoserine dehydrogenase-like protein